MAMASKKKISLNDRVIEQLHSETVQWINLMVYASEEIQFVRFSLEGYLNNPISPKEIGTALALLENLDEKKYECQELTTAIKKHQNDILGMRECEDVYCDNFYSQQHDKWHEKLQDFQLSFGRMKSDIFNLIAPSKKE